MGTGFRGGGAGMSGQRGGVIAAANIGSCDHLRDAINDTGEINELSPVRSSGPAVRAIAAHPAASPDRLGATDTGDTDTGRPAAAHPDTAPTDTGRTDTGHTDTGHTDTGHTDTGHTDTGHA